MREPGRFFCVIRSFLLPCDHLGVGKHQRADALGIVADHRLTEIIGQRAVAVVFAAEACHEADAAQLQTAVRVDRGLDYQDWLKLFFLIQGKSRFCYRMMDMIQNRISEKEPGFRMDQCQYGVSVSYAAQGTLIPLRRTSQKEY